MGQRYISKRLRRAAEGQSCVWCGAEDGTVVLAHLPSWIYGQGSGVGQKTHDWLGGHLCAICHKQFDEGPYRTDTDARMKALCLTLERLFEQGVLHSVG